MWVGAAACMAASPCTCCLCKWVRDEWQICILCAWVYGLVAEAQDRATACVGPMVLSCGCMHACFACMAIMFYWTGLSTHTSTQFLICSYLLHMHTTSGATMSAMLFQLYLTPLHALVLIIHRYNEKPRLPIHGSENLEKAFRFMTEEEKLHLVNIG